MAWNDALGFARASGGSPHSVAIPDSSEHNTYRRRLASPLALVLVSLVANAAIRTPPLRKVGFLITTLLLLVVLTVGRLIADSQNIVSMPVLDSTFANQPRNACRYLGRSMLAALVGALLSGGIMDGFSILSSGAVSPIATITGSPIQEGLFYLQAAIDEEAAFRLFLFSLLVCYLRKLTIARRSPRAIFWAANIIQASIFGLLHQIDGNVLLTYGRVFGSLLVAIHIDDGLIFGYIFMNWGLESAILAHSAANFLLSYPPFHS